MDIVKNTPVKLLFDPYKVDLELKEVKLDDGSRIEGQFKTGTNIPHGVGKQALFEHSDRLYEGLFINGKWNGYGRLLWEDGHYYIGEFHDGYYHGHGKLVMENGQVFEGKWENSQF